MNDQSLPPLPTLPPRSSRLGPVLMVVLGGGALLFAVLAIIGFSQAHSATSTLAAAKLAAAESAKTAQKAADDLAATQANESPFRSYVAPAEYGSFEIKFPKNWSATSDEERSNSTQVSLELSPNFIARANNVDVLLGAKVTLNQRTLTEALKQYASQKTLTQSDITVSGIKAVQLTGTFSDKRTSRLVIVPVRDKTILFSNENKQYNHEFDEILAQSKIVP